jgi:hypothetical protein
MEWWEAQELIEEKIKIGTDLNTDKSTYRVVNSIGNIRDSQRYGYGSEKGFIVQIGKSKRISIPWKMLAKCFLPLSSDKEYDGDYFRRYFPLQATDHPCHVHVVGQLFVKAGIARQKNATYICT